MPTALTVSPASLTITASSVTATYADGTILDGYSGFTVSGLQGTDAVAGVILSTNASLSGSSNWNVGNWTITPSAAFGAAFNPNNYSIRYAGGTLTVNQATLGVGGVIGTDKVYDGGTSDTIGGAPVLVSLAGGDNVTLGSTGASAAFADPTVGTAKTVTFAGYTISGTDACNYTLAQPASSTADILQATPVITWSNLADIVYGTALSSTQLNASTNVLGSFAYTPAAGTVLSVGNNQTLSVVFTPTDSTDYTTATQTVSINVNPPTITLTNPGNQTNAIGDNVALYLMYSCSNGDPLSFSASGLPPGLTIDAATGEITGTIASDANTSTPYSVTITALDVAAGVSANVTFSWTVT